MNSAKRQDPNLEWYRCLSPDERAEEFDNVLSKLVGKYQEKGVWIEGAFAKDWKDYLCLGSCFAYNVDFLRKAIASSFPLVGLFLCSTSYDYNKRFDAFKSKVTEWQTRKILHRLSYCLFHDSLEDAALVEFVRRVQCRLEKEESLHKVLKDRIDELDLRIFHRNGNDRSVNDALNYAIRTASQLLNPIELESSDRQRHLELYELFASTLNLIPESEPQYSIHPHGIEVAKRVHGGDKRGLIKQRIYAQEKKASAIAEKESLRIVRRLQ